MLRSAPRLRRGALLIRGPDRRRSHPCLYGSRMLRSSAKERRTASGTRGRV